GQDRSCARIGQVNVSEIPRGVADGNAAEVAEARRNLETGSFDRDGAIALALAAGDFLAEIETQMVGRRARAANVGRFEETSEWRLAGFGMRLALVLHLDP